MKYVPGEVDRTTVCACCGKKFWKYTNTWQYKKFIKNKTVYFCSYTCDRKDEKENGPRYDYHGREFNGRPPKHVGVVTE